jgi:ClpX C4-type zinc finger
MAVDEGLLREAREAGGRLTEAQRAAETAKAGYYRAIRRLHLAGATLREIAGVLSMSHQRVHQIIDATGGAPQWRHRRTAVSRRRCTFCGSGVSEVVHLIAGPGVCICDRCVVLARQVGAGDRTAGLWLGVMPPGDPLVCSFCHKPVAEVARLVAGPGVLICEPCVAFCAEVVAADRGDG